MRIILFCLAIFLIQHLARAQDAGAVSVEAGAVPAGSGDTRVEVDNETGTVTFFIDGRPAVLVDANGLHVKGDIEYGGTLADVGRDNTIPVSENAEGARHGE